MSARPTNLMQVPDYEKSKRKVSMNRNILLAVASLLLFVALLFSSSVAGDSYGNKYDQLSWLVGSWEGEAFGGVCQEIWEANAGGTMTGTFKLISGNKISFYEFMVIDLSLEQPALILKHFNANMTGWEEKDSVITFPIISMNDKELIFDGMTYITNGSDSLTITLSTKHRDGKVDEIVIGCKRVD